MQVRSLTGEPMKKPLKWRKAFIADHWHTLKGIVIAQHTGMSPQSVSHLGLRMGLPKKKDLTQSKKVTLEDILALRAQGYSYECIGAHLGVSYGVIFRKLKRHRESQNEDGCRA